MSEAGSTLEVFRDRYGRPPTHVVRAPGRVNLIGEHIDYHGLTVAPLAIDRAVHALFAPDPGRRVRAATLEPGLEADDFELSTDLPVLDSGDWRNYVRAAAARVAGDSDVGTGADLLVVSDVPVAAGLSSSSALVVAVGLALERANGRVPGARSFAEAMAEAERFTGTAGGGMDQAACLLSKEGHVGFVDFEPLRIGHVPLPEEWRLIVCDSGERAEKSGDAREAYNERRATGIRALERVAGALGRPGASYGTLLDGFDEARVLEVGERELDAHEWSRFAHVVTEAGRVRNAREALEGRNGEVLGALLRASHASLRDRYAVSTSRLDALVEAAHEAGALGARLTGAGFGGSMIALCTGGTSERVRSALEEASAPWSGTVLDVVPSGGASVMEL